MNSIFMLVCITRGPSGHGEPGMESYSLMDDGGGWVLGSPFPAYSTKELAEEALDKCSSRGTFVVREFPLM